MLLKERFTIRSIAIKFRKIKDLKKVFIIKIYNKKIQETKSTIQRQMLKVVSFKILLNFFK